MKKKVLSLLLIGILFIVLTGCGDTNEKKSKSSGEDNVLSSKVKAGDYVDYKVEKDISYVAPQDKTGYTKDQTFETTGEEKWRVMNVNSDGTIDLIMDGYGLSIIDQGLHFKGKLGVENFESELNNVINIYLNKDYATKARSLNRADIETMLDLEATKKQLLKIYDSDSILYKRDENIDISGTREEALENMSKTYYSYLTGYTYGDVITIDGESIQYNLKFPLEKGFYDCITNEEYRDLLEGTFSVWLGDKPSTSINYNWNYQSYYIDYKSYILSFETDDNGIKWYEMKSSDWFYRLNLSETGENTFTKGSGIEGTHEGNIKPIVTLKSGLKISGGKGTEDSPYTIK